VTDFVNLKIKSTQSFRDAHRGIIYIRMFIKINTHIYKYLRLVFFKHLSITVQPSPRPLILLIQQVRFLLLSSLFCSTAASRSASLTPSHCSSRRRLSRTDPGLNTSPGEGESLRSLAVSRGGCSSFEFSVPLV
jgi:hypothetical protein